MSLTELFFIAVGLSMDAFAVALAKGLGMARLDVRQTGLIAAFFGVAQAIMPLLGWVLGGFFTQFIAAYAHWVAFALLLYVGGKMLVEGLRGSSAEEADTGTVAIGELFMLAVATSIDALAVGVSFAFLEVEIVPSALLIGVTTFALSALGVVLGNRFGSRWKTPATIAGGCILVAIGVKVLLEGLGVL